ncbi:MAG TPA: YggT family protein [Acidimicrobiales bacterium]|nr:YggT family protein [Acidimicrobiales bacterium]
MVDTASKIKGLRFARVVVWLVYAFFVAATIILLFAFFLLLFNASTDASFTQWVYRSANRVLEPFRGIFPTVTNGNGSVIDFAVLFAIIMYGILALVVHALVSWLDALIVRKQIAAKATDAP